MTTENKLPRVVGYLYPDGRKFCASCQSIDASIHNGSPAGTVTLVRPNLPKRNLPVTVQWAVVQDGDQCAECDKVLFQPAPIPQAAIDPDLVGFGIDEFIARTADNVMQTVLEAQTEWHAEAGVNLSDVPSDQCISQRAYICNLIGTELIKDR